MPGAKFPRVNTSPERILFVFLDGIGIGDADPEVNAFLGADLPHLRSLLGGRLPVQATFGSERVLEAKECVLLSVDARLGVPGRPQSGTGQTALLTGRNAPALFGRHFGSWVPTPLRPMLAEQNVLSRAHRGGASVAFVNAHPPQLPLSRRPSAPALAAHAAGLAARGAAELAAGQALASSITNERWRTVLPEAHIPKVTASIAGERLAGMARTSRLTMFAHYDTDFAGHRRSLAQAVRALERVDAFLGGVRRALPADSLLLIASDHGNLEDARTGHTLNPVPVIAVGPGRDVFAERVHAIIDVAPALLELLDLNDHAC
jgi:2,3-bisphosphoglycerate-independent phosphoglycerate mutase